MKSKTANRFNSAFVEQVAVFEGNERGKLNANTEEKVEGRLCSDNSAGLKVDQLRVYIAETC